MVWALSLADPGTTESIENLYLNGMARTYGSAVYAHKAEAMLNYEALQTQNAIALQGFWTECMALPLCPPGFTILTTGHGKLYDLDRGHLSGDGCHGGGNGYNRAFCMEASVQTRGCKWYGKGLACDQFCPANTILVTQNSHIGGAVTGCLTGRYSSFCCDSIESDSIGNCPSSQLENQLTGGLAPRVAPKSSRSRLSEVSGMYGRGTPLECRDKSI